MPADPIASQLAAPAMTARLWGWLLVLSLLWGGSFFFVAVAVRELPSFTLVWLRLALAAAVLLLVLRAMGLRLPRAPALWGSFLAMGVLNNLVPFVLLVWGQHRISGGLASILNATTPLFTMLVAQALTADEKLTPLKTLGVVLGFAGAAVLLGPQALSGLGDDVLAQLACLGASLSYGFAGIYGRRFRRLGLPPAVTATGQVCASSLLLLPLMLLADQPWSLPMPGAATWAAVVGVALFSTVLGYLLYFRILAAAGATNLSLVTFLNPAVAILLGWLLLGETLLPRHLPGMALVALGLACMDGRLFRRR